MHIAIIDFGSNTLRLSVYEVPANKPYDFVQIINKKTMAGLASYYDESNALKDEGIDKAIEILKSYQRKIANFPHAQTFAFGTAVLRKATNTPEIIERIWQACGLKLDVLSGEDEARFGFYGSKHLLTTGKGVQIDLGGGSTELVLFKDKEIEYAHSFDFGSLSLYLNFVSDLIPTPKEMDDIRAHIEEELKNLPEKARVKSYNCLFGLGGSTRAAAKLRDSWLLKGKRSETAEISSEELSLLLDKIAYDPHEAMRNILQVVPDRIHTAVPGILCIQTIQKFFSANTLHISKYGVREGYLLSRVLQV